MANSINYLGTTYEDDEIVSASFSQKQSLNMADLSVDTANIVINPILHRPFYTHEPYPFFTNEGLPFFTSKNNSLSGAVNQDEPIVQRIDGSQVALWYVSSIERQGKNVYAVNANSPLGRLTQRTHYGGIYTGQTAATVIGDICGDLPYYVSSVFADVPLYGWLPIATARDNLQQVLFALNANLRTDSNGALRVENLSDAPSSTILANTIYQDGAKVTYDAPITKIVLLEHQYLPGTESTTLFEGLTTENQIIAFDEPMSALSATGFTILSSGANYAVVSAGNGTLTGNPYIHTTREIERVISNQSIENIVRVESATLVGITASGDVADRLADYYTHRKSIQVSVASAMFRAGDVVNIFDPYDEETVLACLESNNSTMSATTKSSVSALVGYTPWQTIPFEDERVLLTGSGTWTVPADVDEITVVLIGGGDGGMDGAAGQDGTANPIRQPVTIPFYLSAPAGFGGSGGVGGAGGAGGKILRAEITVNEGENFAFSIGVGGAANGGVGGNSIFGNLSSANGSSGGFLDIVTNITYGDNGEMGVTGGKGGNGGQAGDDGENGESVTGGNGGLGSEGYNQEPTPIFQNESHFGGPGGGGAAKSSNGGDAGNSHPSYYGEPLPGGDGANAEEPSNPLNWGNGGNGGHGGGGGGGGGGMTINVNTGEQLTDIAWYNSIGGTGGSGSHGTAGADGCIIIYYRRPISN